MKGDGIEAFEWQGALWEVKAAARLLRPKHVRSDAARVEAAVEAGERLRRVVHGRPGWVPARLMLGRVLTSIASRRQAADAVALCQEATTHLTIAVADTRDKRRAEALYWLSHTANVTARRQTGAAALAAMVHSRDAALESLALRPHDLKTRRRLAIAELELAQCAGLHGEDGIDLACGLADRDDDVTLMTRLLLVTVRSAGEAPRPVQPQLYRIASERFVLLGPCTHRSCHDLLAAMRLLRSQVDASPRSQLAAPAGLLLALADAVLGMLPQVRQVLSHRQYALFQLARARPAGERQSLLRESLAVTDELLRSDPNDRSARTGRSAVCYYLAEEAVPDAAALLETVVADLRAMVAADANDGLAQALLGGCLLGLAAERETGTRELLWVEAEKHLLVALEVWPKVLRRSPADALAQLACQRGQPDHALAWLARWSDCDPLDGLEMLKDRDFDLIREHPEFIALQTRLAAAEAAAAASMSDPT